MVRVARLRASLLVSLGLASVACGGTTQNDPDGEAGGASSQGGSAHAGRQNNATAVCTAPTTDPTTGLVSCAEGFTHRATAGVCSVARPTQEPVPGDAELPGPEDPALPRANGAPCADDAGCSPYLYGYCDHSEDGLAEDEGECASGCTTDDDCRAGSVCLCGQSESPTGGVCRTATCHTDADCGPGKLCASYQEVCGPGGFACQAAADECLTNADCKAPDRCYWEAIDSADGSLPYHRACGGAVCGRPFLVAAQARVATVVNDGAWRALDERSPRLDHLTRAERAVLAQHWTRMGQMEHASVAAFARFSLQLLSLGAPADLVEACNQALVDETAHARLCFGLASAYAGRSVGPGPLDVEGSLLASSLADIVDLVIVEGCFGETSATLEALEAAEIAADPVIGAAYSQIARDERSHAELAFRFVRWALERDRSVVAERITLALANPAPHGSAARAVVEPCLEALLEHAAAA